jgi:MFS family permease
VDDTERDPGHVDEPPIVVTGAEPIGEGVGPLDPLARTGGPAPAAEHSDAYLRTLLLLLLAASFFEGYDGAVLSLVLGSIRDTFNVAESMLGVSRALIELGLGAAFFLARAGDRFGRRKLLLWSVLGYTLMTTLTAFSWDLWSFTAFQSLSRVFLGAEYAVAVTMIVEEFPPKRRGKALGTLLMCAAVGAVAVALLLLAGVEDGPFGWRTLYLVGVIPLLFLAFFRRRLKETRRFQEHQQAVAEGARESKVGFFEPWRPAYRWRLVLVGLISLLRSLPLFGATSWFFYFAEREAGIKSSYLYLIFIVSYGFGTLGYLTCGWMMERYGRRPTGILFSVMTIVSAVSLFQVRSALGIGALLVVAVFFGLGQAPVMGAVSTELFPTYIRNQSAAWARNVFEIGGFILGPLLVGTLGDHYTGALGSVGDAVSLLVLLSIPALWLYWRHLPETKGRELEDIEAALGTPSEAEAERRSGRNVVVAFAVLGGIVAAVVAGVIALGSFEKRPEGAAERFLQAISARNDEEIGRFGDRAIAQRLASGGPTDEDDDVFETIEVGAARRDTCDAAVPFKVVIEGSERVVGGTFAVRMCPDDADMRVAAMRDQRAGERVPSDGGPTPEGASPMQWLLALLAVLAFSILCELMLRSLGPRPSGAHAGPAPR